MGSKGGLGVTWKAETAAVKVGQRCWETYGSERSEVYRRETQNFCVSTMAGWPVSSGLDLVDGAEELVDLDVVNRKPG